MSRLQEWLRAHPFLRHNLVFFVGSLIVSVLNYLYYPVLGRLLGLSEFGEVQVVVSLFAQLALFFGAFSMVTANIASNVHDVDERNRLVFELEKIAFMIMGAAGLIAFVAIIPVQHFLQLGSPWPLIALLAALIVSVPLAFGTSYLQGRQRFTEMSLVNILSATAKLVLAAGLVLAGLGAFGAIGGIALASTLAWLLVASRARKAGYHWPKARGGLHFNLSLVRNELGYAGLVLIVSLVSTLLYTGDIVVVKHFFSPDQAGAYAGIAVVGRIIFFLTGSIGGVMFPAIKQEAAPRENRRILAFSLGLVTLLGGGALAVFSLVPRLIIQLLLGSRYLALAHLLPRLSLALFMISIINLFFFYHLALRRRFVALIASAGGAVTFGLLTLRHASIAAVINDLILGSLFILIALGIWSLYKPGRILTTNE